MYIIKADGKLLYSPELIDDGYKLISPRMHLEINAAGSLDFTIPPCNALYDDVQKMKSIITVEQDGEVVFRGRISEESVDTYKQRRVYCEGDLAFLLDSLQGPASFTGTQFDLFSQLIAAHNAQMEADKQFTLGDVSGLDREEVFSFDVTTYADTLSMVQSYLIDLFGGYIQTRTEGGVTYIDYVDGFVGECSQKIEFGVNLLNFESQINAEELCTVLVPLGATLDDGTALTIASVNGGMVYIENPEAIARYGRVYKTYTWENVTDPAELLELANEYMQGAGLPETLSITALDMHLVDADVEKIRKGSMVHLLSKPHGIDKKIVCASIDADLENGDQTVFVLGLPKQRLKTLAEQVEEAAAGLDGVISEFEDIYTDFEDIYIDLEDTMDEVNRVSGKVDDHHKWLTETDTSLNIAIEHLDLIGHRVNQVEVDVDAAEAAITLKANQTSVDVLEERMSGAEVRIDGAEAEITLKAAQSVVDAMGQRLTGAEVRIDGAEAEITLKAAKSTVDEMGERLSTAELRIDGAESTIEAKADLILLDGYVKMDEFEALQAYVEDYIGDSLSVTNIVAGYGDFDSLWVGQINGGSVVDSSHTHSLTVGSDGSVTIGEVSSSGGSFNIADTSFYKDGVSAAKNSVTLSAAGWVGGVNVVSASNGKSLNISLPSFSVSGGDSFSSNKTTVYFYTGSVSGPLASKTVDASGVYNSGYNSGYSSGNSAGFNSGYNSGYTAGQASIDTGAYYDEGYSIGYSAGVNSVDTTSYYNDGWNDCRDACSLVTVYTISENSPGTLYMKVGDYYSSVGSSWVKVSRMYGVYTIPSAKS